MWDLRGLSELHPHKKSTSSVSFKCGLLDKHISPFARAMNLKHPVITGLFSVLERGAPCEMVSCQSATAVKLCDLTLVSKCQRAKTGSGLIWESCLPQPPPRTPTDQITHRSSSACQLVMGREKGIKGNYTMPFPFTQYPDSHSWLIQPPRVPRALFPL